MTSKGLTCIDCNNLSEEDDDEDTKHINKEIKIDGDGIKVIDKNTRIKIDKDGIEIKKPKAEEKEEVIEIK
jgi:hypothetical protein